MEKKIYLIILLGVFLFLSGVLPSQAQTFKPIFEDGEGRSSIIAPLGFLGINTENSSIRFQYFYAKAAALNPRNPQTIKRNRFYWGVNVAGSAAGGIANLFNYGTFTPGTSASLFLGHRSLLFPALDKEGAPVLYGQNEIAIEDWITFRVGGQVANYTLYDANRIFAEQISKERFRGYLTQLAYNVLIGGATSIGVSWDVARENNIGDLSPVKFKQQTIMPDPNGQTTRIFEREVNAYSGVYETSIVNTYSLDAVRYFTPASEINYALHLYGRLKHTNERPVYRAGVGFYLFPKNKVAGGLFVESSDLTNEVSDTQQFSKRIDMGLTVKFILPGLGVPSP
ncbi:hypothetical protein AAE02nite_50580 [Adhaeribacter aerolatus]|uniref:Type IX secretion system membrane protein PorP/SprF n=1 Tax=Adhaeribacter aerolatus TaxID=670289 RepID=A0A512B605_9BACT|nr:hypothetical protein [Adhaeribacter aerolatus]GEO07394.1 hypothetical protein AAE02nite_50580 [Adhaeribacter aerolatus]